LIGIDPLVSLSVDTFYTPAVEPIRALNEDTQRAVVHATHLPVLRPPEFQPGPILAALVQQIVTIGMLSTAAWIIHHDVFPLPTFLAFIQLFSVIESSIDEDYVSFLLPKLFEVGIEVAKRQPADSAVSQFLTTVREMVPNMIDRVFSLFCEWSSQWNSSQTRFTGLGLLIQLVTDAGT
jgi:hypothetical protein